MIETHSRCTIIVVGETSIFAKSHSMIQISLDRTDPNLSRGPKQQKRRSKWVHSPFDGFNSPSDGWNHREHHLCHLCSHQNVFPVRCHCLSFQLRRDYQSSQYMGQKVSAASTLSSIDNTSYQYKKPGVKHKTIKSIVGRSLRLSQLIRVLIWYNKCLSSGSTTMK